MLVLFRLTVATVTSRRGLMYEVINKVVKLENARCTVSSP